MKYSENVPVPTACFEIKLGLLLKKRKSEDLKGSFTFPVCK
jgi:hypothetical protein